MFTRILVPLDGSKRSEDALAGARALAERFGSRLVLLQVATWPAYLLDMIEAHARLDQYAAPLRAAGFDALTVVRDDIAEDGIAAVAQETSADLIVLAPHKRIGRERLSHILRPSVSTQMVSHAPIPFLIIPGPPHTERALNLLTRDAATGPIMLALDGSPLAEQGIPLATALARSFDQRLLLARVVPVDPMNSLGGAQPSTRRIALQTILEDEQAAHRYVAGARRDIVAASPVKVQTRVVSGEPVEKLLEIAETEDACFLVVATHGRGGLARVLIGSVATALVHQTTVPLLVVPPMAAITSRAHVDADTTDTTDMADTK